MRQNNKRKIDKILHKMGVDIVENKSLFYQAFVHPSYLSEIDANTLSNNQRLEFLGDAVVGLIIASYLFDKYPQKSEGELTRIRAGVVCEASLAEVARNNDFGDFLLLGRGEDLMGGSDRNSNLADCFEAFIGACYFSLGLEKTSNLLIGLISDQIEKIEKGAYKDYKTQLQEIIQQNTENQISYKIIKEEGPDHEKIFHAAVLLNDTNIASGTGRSKKEAQQRAAKAALGIIGDDI